MNTQCSYFCLSVYLNIEIFYLLGTIAIKMQGFNFLVFPNNSSHKTSHLSAFLFETFFCNLGHVLKDVFVFCKQEKCLFQGRGINSFFIIQVLPACQVPLVMSDVFQPCGP